MKTLTNIKSTIYRLLFVAAIILLANVSKTVASTNGAILRKSADTSSANESYKNITSVQKNVLAKQEQAFQRAELLDKLSKQPAENPEIFSNAKEEYLYFEKARADGEAYEIAVNDGNVLLSAKLLW